MEKIYDRDRLVHKISQWGTKLVEMRQVLSRLHRLLPRKVEDLTQHYRKDHRAGKAHRLALLDASYLAELNEMSELTAEVIRTKVDWETHLMLFRTKVLELSRNKR